MAIAHVVTLGYGSFVTSVGFIPTVGYTPGSVPSNPTPGGSFRRPEYGRAFVRGEDGRKFTREESGRVFREGQ